MILHHPFSQFDFPTKRRRELARAESTVVRGVHINSRIHLFLLRGDFKYVGWIDQVSHQCYTLFDQSESPI